MSTVQFIEINHDHNRSLRDGEEAVGKYLASRLEARNQIMSMARGLLSARRLYPADQAFGDWLKGSPYAELSHQDRAALIKIGEHECCIARLWRTSTLASPRTVWDEFGEAAQAMRPEVYRIGKPASVELIVDKTQDGEAESDNVKVEPIEKVARYGTRSGQRNAPATAARLKLVKELGFDAGEADRVCGAYPPMRQKTLRAELAKVPKHVARRMFDLALATVDAGKAPEIGNSATSGVDPRMFWPEIPEVFCRQIRRLSLPQLDKERDKLGLIDTKLGELKAAGASEADILTMASTLWHSPDPAAAAAGVTAMPAKATTAVVKPPSEAEVRFCGKVIWPRNDGVTEDDVHAGYHVVALWAKRLATGIDKQPSTVVGTLLRHLINDMNGASSLKGLTKVMWECVAAYDGEMKDMKAPPLRIKHAGSR